MSIQNILLYLSRALVLSLFAGAVWSILYFAHYHKTKSYKWYALMLVWVCYLAALFQITVIRDYTQFLQVDIAAYSLQSVRLIPLHTTIQTAQHGLYSFIYNLVGNLIWFVPFGVLFPMVFPKRKMWNVIAFAALTSFSIEVLQFIFQSGISDIDDLILNTLGALLGFYLYRLLFPVRLARVNEQLAKNLTRQRRIVRFLSVTGLVVLTLIALVPLLLKLEAYLSFSAQDVAVIGGADGPTAIYLTSTGTNFIGIALFIGAVCLCLYGIYTTRRK